MSPHIQQCINLTHLHQLDNQNANGTWMDINTSVMSWMLYLVQKHQYILRIGG